MSIKVHTSFHDIPENLHEKTVRWYDVDQTLIESKTYLGSGPFYFHLRNIFENFVPKTEGLKEKLIAYVISKVDYETEKGLPESLAACQEKGQAVLGITARNKDLAKATHEQLSSIGIHLDDIHFSEKEAKGPYLVKHFAITKKPEYLVFGDDYRPNVVSVAHAMEQINVPCYAFEYRPYLNNPLNDGFRPTNLWGASFQLENLVQKSTLVEDWDANKQSASKSFEEGKQYFQDVIQRIDEEIHSHQLSLKV